MKILAGLVAVCALAQQPYKDAREFPSQYEGPGREEPEPEGLTEVRIGFFGPADASHPEGGAIWQGAARAIEEANRAGGYRGLPYRLVSRWSDNPWRAGAAHVVRMAYEDRVWAIIGGIDGRDNSPRRAGCREGPPRSGFTGQHRPQCGPGGSAVDVLLHAGR